MSKIPNSHNVNTNRSDWFQLEIFLLGNSHRTQVPKAVEFKNCSKTELRTEKLTRNQVHSTKLERKMAGQYLLLEWTPSSDMRASQEILSNRKAPCLSSALEDADAETLPPLPRGSGTAKECERGARAPKVRGETESREGAITRSSSSCSLLSRSPPSSR